MVSTIVLISQVLSALMELIPKVIAFCAVLAAIVPPQTGGVLGTAYKFLNAVAFNVKYAKNVSEK